MRLDVWLSQTMFEIFSENILEGVNFTRTGKFSIILHDSRDLYKYIIRLHNSFQSRAIDQCPAKPLTLQMPKDW